ncbi:hypothetical protein [uncultured Psychrobacter sp.]|uniref:hypothetical protein n=1 Tax=uncultured Psychrobacter sp. TaxID=259303 RepID=UPI00345A23EA
MFKLIKSVFLAGILTSSLVSCTSTNTPISNAALPTKQGLSFEEKKQLLIAKMKLADFTFKAIDDPEFIEILSSDFAQTSEDKQCVFDNIDRARFNELFEEKVEESVNNDPQYVDLYLDKLDLLISINDIFYSHPTEIKFNEENLSASPAFTVLSTKDAKEFETMILDERYLNLLAQIGQPAKLDGVITDFADVKTFILSIFVSVSGAKCGLVE